MPTEPKLRLSTGVPAFDTHLGGGLVPGTLTVLIGATGIGKTQLGLQFAEAGRIAEGRPGVIYDMTSRGDPQSHADYARRMFERVLTPANSTRPPSPEVVFDVSRPVGDYLHVFDYQGRRVTRGDLSFEDWQLWQAELATKLGVTIGFFYSNFLRGARRAVIDGLEPSAKARDSIQVELFEYVYHQILRKDPEWVARDLLRERFRHYAEHAERLLYDPKDIACLVLYTSREVMLDDLISRPIDEGDLLANANTIIHLGKIRDGAKLGRALHISKHRGSAASEEILPFTIDDSGVRVL